MAAGNRSPKLSVEMQPPTAIKRGEVMVPAMVVRLSFANDDERRLRVGEMAAFADLHSSETERPAPSDSECQRFRGRAKSPVESGSSTYVDFIFDFVKVTVPGLFYFHASVTLFTSAAPEASSESNTSSMVEQQLDVEVMVDADTHNFQVY